MRELTNQTLFNRTLTRIRRAFRDAAGTARIALFGELHPDLPETEQVRLLQRIGQSLGGKGGEVSARARAAALGRVYLSLSSLGRQRFLKLLAEKFGPDATSIRATFAAWDRAADEETRNAARLALRSALEAPRERLLRRFTAVPEGMKFLVDLRAELAGFARRDAALSALDEELLHLLGGWFDIAFLDLQTITWQAPAALLEKLIAYEAVHQITSWDDLKNRLDSDRRCFAFFHPRMPGEPLIFVEVALEHGLAGSVQDLLDEREPALAVEEANTAIFYSISNCQQGLSGLSFGNFLIKRVVDVLARELPHIKTFATLSPIPGFRTWLDSYLKEPSEEALLPSEAAKIAALADPQSGTHGTASQVMRTFLDNPEWHRHPDIAAALKEPLMRLCAYYLLQVRQDRQAKDRVAHFHLSNGARIERLNWLGDTSSKGLRQSAGLMVNYGYKLEQIEANHEAYSGNGQIVAATSLHRLAGE